MYVRGSIFGRMVCRGHRFSAFSYAKIIFGLLETTNMYKLF